MSLTLVIGNKNYSSWSLRAWIAMAASGIPFDEVFVPLALPDTKERIKRHSPAGKVPVLIDGDAVIWELLAILEHLAERFPKAACGRQSPRRAPMRARSRRRCMRAFSRCAANAR